MRIIDIKEATNYIDVEWSDGLTMVAAERHNTRIERAEFEQWVDLQNGRDWVMDYSDHAGEHVQKTGTMTFEEYYDSDSFIPDLKTYIKTKKNNGNN
jgi:hypothetical protein